MSFSQGWDAGFKSILLFAGVVFLWLLVLEGRFADRNLSVMIMAVAAFIVAAGYFIHRRRQCTAERRAADVEVAALLGEEG